jgi:hypothetical protein
MANGGGSRIGGFIRGVLVGLVVCAVAAVALSLWAPLPERGPIEMIEPGAPGAAGVLDPAAGAPEATPPADVTGIPAEPVPGGAESGTAGTGETVPQPTLPDATSGAGEAGSNFSDEPPAAPTPTQ